MVDTWRMIMSLSTVITGTAVNYVGVAVNHIIQPCKLCNMSTLQSPGIQQKYSKRTAIIWFIWFRSYETEKIVIGHV